jgi:hypothetical protein
VRRWSELGGEQRDGKDAASATDGGRLPKAGHRGSGQW